MSCLIYVSIQKRSVALIGLVTTPMVRLGLNYQTINIKTGAVWSANMKSGKIDSLVPLNPVPRRDSAAALRPFTPYPMRSIRASHANLALAIFDIRRHLPGVDIIAQHIEVELAAILDVLEP